MSLIHLTASAEDFTGEYACNLAAVGQSTVHALSCAGDHTAIRFLHAAMRDKGQRVSFKFSDRELFGWGSFTVTTSYEVRISHLGYDCWHLLAVDDGNQFLLHDDEETLWAMLRSERFTTPIIRSWMPKVSIALRNLDLLTKLTSFGCDAAMLTANTESLDRVVSEGLKRRVLRITTPMLCEAV